MPGQREFQKRRLMQQRARFRHAPSRLKEDERRRMLDDALALLDGLARDRAEEARRRGG